MKIRLWESFFSEINNREKAYWLGFIYADGCNQSKHYLSMLLSVHDKKHLRKFCHCMRIPISRIYIMPPPKNPTIEGRHINAAPSCRLVLTSKKLSRDLLNLGVFPRKAFTLKFPKQTWIPQRFMSHFVRGFFDGDGCISQSKNNSATRYRIAIVSSHCFCKKLARFLIETLGINAGIWRREKISLVSISGNRQVETFCDWMYKGSTKWIQLDRKRKSYDQLKRLIRRINRRYTRAYSVHPNITWDKKRQLWMAGIRKNKKTRHIGRFSSEKSAYIAQQAFYKKYNLKQPKNIRLLTK